MIQANMIENHTQIVNIRDFKKGVLYEVPRFIYTGKVSSDDSLKKQARDILAVANKYQIGLLKKLCEAQLVSTLDASNCVELIVLGDLHQAANLKKTAWTSFQRIPPLVKTDAYKQFLRYIPNLVFEVTLHSINGFEQGDEGRDPHQARNFLLTGYYRRCANALYVP